MIEINNKELIKQLGLFRDKTFCYLSIEWGHVQCGHGFTQTCAALDTEIKKCIEYLNI